jgi:transcriptional regulator with XRE-family HTH domain
MKLLQFLNTHEISQLKFAKKIGITAVNLNKIVHGMAAPRLDTAAKIVYESYGKVTFGDLLNTILDKEGKKKQRSKTKDRAKKAKLRRIKKTSV